MIMCCMSEINVRSTKLYAAQGEKEGKRRRRKEDDKSRTSRCNNVFKEKIMEVRLVLFIQRIYFIQFIIWCLLSFSPLGWGATTL